MIYSTNRIESLEMMKHYFLIYMARTLKIDNGTIEFKDTYEVLIEKKVTKFGTGAKVDCPKEYLGRKVYLLIR